MEVGQTIIEVVAGGEVIALVALMAANVILSIVAAVSQCVFTFRKIGDFVSTRVVPLIAYLVVALLAEALGGEWTAVAITVYAGLVALYSTGILAAIKSLTGLNIPSVLCEKVKEK